MFVDDGLERVGPLAAVHQRLGFARLVRLRHQFGATLLSHKSVAQLRLGLLAAAAHRTARHLCNHTNVLVIHPDFLLLFGNLPDQSRLLSK